MIQDHIDKIGITVRRIQLDMETKRMFRIGKRLPQYGSYMRLLVANGDTVFLAQEELYRRTYLPLKALLRRYGVRLGPIEWIIHEPDSDSTDDILALPSVAWRAKAADHMSREMCHRMMLARKRANRLWRW